MSPRTALRRHMEQIRAKTNLIHDGEPYKAGHIFKVPEDMSLDVARRLVDKGLATDSIEVLEEDETVLADTQEPADLEDQLTETLEADESTDTPEEEPEVTDGEAEVGEDEPEEHDHDAPDGSAGHEHDVQNTDPEEDENTEPEPEAEEPPVAIEDMSPDELREELTARNIYFAPNTGEKKLRIKLAEALEAEKPAEAEEE